MIYLYFKNISGRNFRKLIYKFKNKNISNHIFNLNYFRDYNLFERFYLLWTQKNYLDLYKKNVQKNLKIINSIDNPFLVIYAHHQPEASTAPEGGDFTSHIDLIIELRVKGYVNKIFYKEHPIESCYLSVDGSGKIFDITKAGLHKSPQYFKNLKFLNCELLPPNFRIDYNKKTLKSFVPVTITGSIALERSLLGLKTIVFGNPWYKNAPGIIHIDNIDSLSKINKNWAIPDKAIEVETIKWLKEIMNNKLIFNSLGISILKNGIQKKDYLNTFVEINKLFEMMKKDFIN